MDNRPLEEKLEEYPYFAYMRFKRQMSCWEIKLSRGEIKINNHLSTPPGIVHSSYDEFILLFIPERKISY